MPPASRREPKGLIWPPQRHSGELVESTGAPAKWSNPSHGLGHTLYFLSVPCGPSAAQGLGSTPSQYHDI